MKIRSTLLIAWLLLSSVSLESKPLDLRIIAKSAVLLNADTGQILYENRAEHSEYPASTTKVATTLFVLEEYGKRLSHEIAVPYEAIGVLSAREKEKRGYGDASFWQEPDGTSAGLKQGEQYTVRDLLYASMLVSGNDADNALAAGLERDIPTFMAHFNGWLNSSGFDDTHFCNPHGLFDPDHVTTALDLARLIARGWKHPEFMDFFGAKSRSYPSTKQQPARTLYTTCRLLKKGEHYHQHVVGGKTGTLSKAGYCITAAAEKDGRRLVAVLLGCESNDARYEQVRKMFDVAFAEPRLVKTFYPAGEQSFSHALKGGNIPLKTRTDAPIDVAYYPSEEQAWKARLVWGVSRAPVQQDDVVGQLQILGEDDTVIASHPLRAAHNVELGMWAKITDLLLRQGWAVVLTEVLAAVVVLILFAGMASHVSWRPSR